MGLIPVGSQAIGADQPVYVIAEAGINHDKDIAVAHAMIDTAAAAGASAVKFQNFRVEEFVIDRNLTYSYEKDGQVIEERQVEMFDRYELPSAWLGEISAHCHEVGVTFLSTPMSVRGVDELVALGVPLLKNGSDCLTHLPLIRYMGATGLPLLLSTGMGTLADIARALEAFYAGGGLHVVIMHCRSVYPVAMEDLDLHSLNTLRSTFDVPVGLSDHSVGTTAAVIASALGAVAIEKHFTLDRARVGPDHRFSADPQELAELVRGVSDARKAVGQGKIGPIESEMEMRDLCRLSCTAARELARGQRIRLEDVLYARPGIGLPPGSVTAIVGRSLRVDVARGHQFRFDDFE